MKNKFKIKALVLMGAIVVIAFGGHKVLFAARSWDDGVVENENAKWEKSIDDWGKVIDSWSENRDNLHEKYYGDNFEDNVSGCLDNECWEESMFDLSITYGGSEKVSFERDRCDVRGVFENGDFWECSNGGQVISFKSSNGRNWDSSNSGQVLTYKDNLGNVWKSENEGQSINFTGANGESWESSNNGQIVEHRDSDGNVWSGSDDDTVGDMD